VLSQDSVGKDGRRLDKNHVIVCIIATQLQFIIHFPPVSSGFRFHTHIFRSLLRVLYASPTVQDTPSRNSQLWSANATSHEHAQESWIRGCGRSVGPAAIFYAECVTRSLQKRPKRSERWNIVGPYIPYDLLQTKGETSAKFSGDRFRNVDFYRVQTQEADKKEQKAISALYIRRFYTTQRRYLTQKI